MSKVYSYNCIGLLSGSSLDGVDIAFVEFDIDPTAVNPIVNWTIKSATTQAYSASLVDSLRSLPKGSALDLVKLDDELGQFFGQCIQALIPEGDSIDFISSHGHTIFHHPGKSSTQIGNPAIIAAKTGIQTIGHLRNMDTAYGGQGAPLAPMADLYLLQDYDVCVNLGGIANISVKENGKITGFDVCGANQFLNHLSQQVDKPYDDGGAIARSGSVDQTLLESLNDIPYCSLPTPKSLDNEEVRSYYLPILSASALSIPDQLATMVEHIAIQIGECITNQKNIHLAGGGAHNTYLVDRLKAILPTTNIHVPSAEIIDFKEATLIAMCGALRLHNLPNSLKSITGASKDTVNGVIFQP